MCGLWRVSPYGTLEALEALSKLTPSTLIGTLFLHFKVVRRLPRATVAWSSSTARPIQRHVQCLQCQTPSTKRPLCGAPAAPRRRVKLDILAISLSASICHYENAVVATITDASSFVVQPCEVTGGDRSYSAGGAGKELSLVQGPLGRNELRAFGDMRAVSRASALPMADDRLKYSLVIASSCRTCLIPTYSPEAISILSLRSAEPPSSAVSIMEGAGTLPANQGS